MYNFTAGAEAWWDEIRIATEATPDWLALNPLSGTVPGGSSVDVEVTFTAVGMDGGDYNSMVTVASNDPDEPEVEVPAHLHVTGVPDIAVEPSLLGFGETYVGFPKYLPLTVSNHGTDVLTISNITADIPEFSVDVTSFSVAAHEDTVIQVAFTPSSPTAFAGHLSITSDDPDTPVVTVNANGQGVRPPIIAVSPSSLYDSLLTGETSTHTLTIDNTAGGSDLAFNISVEGPGAALARARMKQLSPSSAVYPLPEGAAFAADRVIVKLKTDTQRRDINALQSSLNASVLRRFSSIGAELWSISGISVTEVIAQYRSDPRIEYIEPDYQCHALRIPNDPHFSKLYGMHNTGQTGGLPDADIDAPEAWDDETGDEVIVGVIDTGVDYLHPDLADNIWVNEDEIPNNGVDDDGNGYIDDIHGWDFYNNDNDPYDDIGHGTHCSGTIAGVGDNGIGVAGVCWRARIMALKFIGPEGGWTSDAILAVLYATANGARLTSNSWGGGGYSQALHDAIDTAGAHNQLFVAAAGNNGTDNDLYPAYPASYDLGNIIAVAATDSSDNRPWWSNYGAVSVDLGAPGVNIYSTIPGNGYGYNSGTSMACPHVSGACALVWAKAPFLSNYEVRDVILANVDSISSLAGITVTWGRLNVWNAIKNVTTWLTLDTLEGVISPGSSMNIEVTFDATGLFGDLYEANIVVSSNDPARPEVTVPAQLRVTGIAAIAVEPDSLDFGRVFIDSPGVRTFTVTSQGTDSLTVSDIASDHPDFSADVSRFTLGDGEQQVVQVTFIPRSEGPITGTLTISSNDPSQPEVTVTLAGEGQRPPDIAVAPDSLTADLLTGQTAVQYLTIANTADIGASDLYFDISIEEGLSANSLPRSAGPQPGHGEWLYRAEQGIWAARDGANGDSALAFPSAYRWQPEKPSSEMSILVYADDVTHYAPNTFPDQALQRLGLAYTAHYDADWSGFESDLTSQQWDLVLMAGDSYWPPLSVYDALNNYVIDGGHLVFHGPTVGDNPGHPLWVTLGFVWSSDDVDYPPDPIYWWKPGDRVFNRPEQVPEFTSFFGGVYWRNGQRVEPLPGFEALAGFTNTGPAPNMASIVRGNDGRTIFKGFKDGQTNADLDADGLLDGVELWTNLIRCAGGVDWLSVNPSSATIVPGDSLVLDAVFDATSIDGGDYHARIIVASNDPDEPEVEVPAHLHVTGAPEIAVDPDSLEFGDVYIGYPENLSLWIINRGTDVLTVSSIVADVPEFTADPSALDLAPRESTVVQVTFAPVPPGEVVAHLSLNSNDPDEQVYVVHMAARARECPELAFHPDTVRESLFTGEMSVDTVFVKNTEPGGLEFSFPDFAAAAALSDLAREHNNTTNDVGFLELAKGEEDPRVGQPVVMGAGGPDSAGYRWIDSDEPGGPVFDFIDITLTGTQVYFPGDDSYIGPFPVGFPFRFYDSVYTQFYLCDNGVITFAPKYIPYYNQPIPQADGYNGLIAWCWGDLVPYSPGRVFYQQFPDRLIIQFDDYKHYFTNGMVDAEVILYRNGGIEFRYDRFSGDFYPNWKTVGIENESGTDGLQVVFNAPYLHDDLAVLFSRMPQWITGVSPASGTIAFGDSVAVEVTLDAAELFGGDYTGALQLASNDCETPDTNVFVCLHVTGAPEIVVDPDSLEFGEVYIGYPENLSLWIINRGTDVLSVSSIVSDNALFEVNPISFDLQPQESTAVLATFAPTDSGEAVGHLVIESNDSDEHFYAVAVEGEGLIPPDIAVSPDSLQDSLITDEISTQTLTVANLGGSDLAFNVSIRRAATRARSGPASFPALGLQAGAGSTRSSVDTSFAPVPAPPIVASRSANSPNVLIFRDNLAWGFDVNVPLLQGFGAGVTTAPSSQMSSIDLSPYDLILFESQQPFSFYASYAASIGRFESFLNTGGVIEFHCATWSSYRLPNLPFPGGMRTLASENGHSYNYIADPSHPIVAGAADPLWGDFASHEAFENLPPAATTIVVNESARPTTVEYPYGGGVLIVTGMTWEIGFALGWSSGVPLLPNALQYALDLCGSARWLSVNPTSGFVFPDDNMELAVTFDATDMLSGDYAANIVISSNDSAQPQKLVPAHLHVTGVPDIAVDPDSLEFGDVYIGYPENLSLLIINEGTDVLTVSSIVADVSEFTVDPSALVLAQGESTVVQVIFDPSPPGEVSAHLTLTSNDPDPDESTYVVQLHAWARECPELAFHPDTLRESLSTGGIAVDTVFVKNAGPDMLEFQFPDYAAAAVLSDPAREHNNTANDVGFLEVAKGEEDPRVGQPVVMGAGGPDSTGYRWIDSDEPGGPVFDFIDISLTGIPVYGLQDDNHVGPFPLGFAFPFYDSSYTQFYIQSNGVINFHSRYISLSNQTIPVPDSYNDLIAWCWDDLYGYTGHVYYQQFPDKLVIQFDHYGRYAYPGAEVDAEVILYANGTILFQYDEFRNGFPTISATVGIENAYGTDGLQVVFNAPYLHDDLAVLFSRMPRWITGVSPASGEVASGDSLPVAVTFSAAGLDDGDYAVSLQLSSNDCRAPDTSVYALLNKRTCDCGVWGDLNADSEIASPDVVIVIKYVYMGEDIRILPPACPQETGDVNCDGDVNPVDVVLYVNYVYRNETPWPCADPCGP